MWDCKLDVRYLNSFPYQENQVSFGFATLAALIRV